MIIRQPIVVVMGHVDHGKTSVLDRIRKTSVSKREAGGITQHIGASEVPAEVIQKICGEALKRMKVELKIPGLLFIDTPGHEAFTNLRRRGGSMADIAVLVLDVMQGFQPQTLEALEILKEYKTPFIVALNKVDLVNGWIDSGETSFNAALAKQREDVQVRLDEKLYEIVGRLYELGFSAERYDRVGDHAKQIAIVPLSAKTGEGITELLMLLAGLSQKYLEKRLAIEVKGSGRGNILEVKEERGLGTTVDVILSDGTIKKNDLIVFATENGGATTKVRALLKPKPLDEMRDPREKFDSVEQASAACGVKIYAPGLEHALAGSSIAVVDEAEAEKVKAEMANEVKEVLVNRDYAGVIVKADTLGSVEALTKLLEKEDILVKKASIGPVNKRDVSEASAVRNENPLLGVVLTFNVRSLEDAKLEAASLGVTIMNSTIVYTLIENYKAWKVEEERKSREEAYKKLVAPAKFKVLEGHCFRASKPCIVGVEILAGKLKPHVRLIGESGDDIGEVKEIQNESKKLEEAGEGMQVALSIAGASFEKDLNFKDVILTSVPKEHIAEWRDKYAHMLSETEMEMLSEIEKRRRLRD
ncbi:MAG: translation initiation factor IF-2 [Candidatus Burarchaeum sp.]|nr:translation initiation factor IF-2 [Candidatus Burarchaeum sp.]MDO8340045.1 translation initiation factor IF-2 [Candidatus Burarchaeum sp.]